MRSGILLLAALCVLPAAGAAAETTPLTHLDCYFDETAKAISCPEVLPMGRAAAEISPAAAPQAQPAAKAPQQAESGAGDSAPAQGTPEWNAYCAGKYNSFDPATGTYTSYSGKTRPCR